MTEVVGVKCDICSDVLYSRADKDSRECSCGNVVLTGTLFEIKRTNSDAAVTKVTIPFSLDDLHTDWNLRVDKLGLISGT